jgi:hypothetical protein
MSVSYKDRNGYHRRSADAAAKRGVDVKLNQYAGLVYLIEINLQQFAVHVFVTLELFVRPAGCAYQSEKSDLSRARGLALAGARN